MRMDERADRYGHSDDRVGFERVANDALSYLRSRRSEHWLMFLAGLVVGLILS